jgi:hypothetical protein
MQAIILVDDAGFVRVKKIQLLLAIKKSKS